MNAEFLLMVGLVCCGLHVSWMSLEGTIRLYGYTTSEIRLLRGRCAPFRETPKAVLQMSSDVVDTSQETRPEGTSEEQESAAVGTAKEDADRPAGPAL